MKSTPFGWTLPGLVLIIAVLACNLPGPSSITPTSLQTPIPFKTTPVFEPTVVQQLQTTPTPPVQTPSSIPTYEYLPVLEPAECAFPVPGGTNPDCGYLMVPENRMVIGSPLIRLHVAIFYSLSTQPAEDPVIYLSGGPGSSGLDLAGYLFRRGLGAVLDRSDLVFIDQRGTGYSIPRLDCPERYDLIPSLLENRLSQQDEAQAVADAFHRCRERLLSDGIDLSAYNSSASAADINDLRIALGKDRVNLYAVSYGTRLALTIMRDYPAGLRSVVLDSVYPLEQNLYTSLAPNAERSFDVLFRLCDADPQCSDTYPDLRNVFYELVDRLEESPLQVLAFDGQVNRPILVDGGLLIDVLFVGMYNPIVTATMPRMIYGVRQGSVDILRERLELYFDHSTALGMQMAVQCSEEILFSSVDDLYSMAQGVQPQIANFFPGSVVGLFVACQEWKPDKLDPRENQPVSSDIPTLILSGEFDPITPPEWAHQTAEFLTRAYIYDISSNGHWVTRSSACALQMVLNFWADPELTPSSDCLTTQPGLIFR